jgi:hypothetical protein
MSVKRITKSDFASFVDSLIRTENVIGVQAKGDRFDFAPWNRQSTFGWTMT